MRSPSRSRSIVPVAIGLGLCLSGCGGTDYVAPTPVTSGPISLTCSASPTAGIVPLTVTLAVKVTPTPQTLTIQYGDGTASNNPNALHVYKTPGSFALVVSASSGSQNASCNQTITASAPPPAPPNSAPTLNARTNPAPATGPAPFVVAFNACKTVDPDNDKLEFTYDFGDGDKKSSGRCSTDHTYARGNYTAQVCVTDEQPGHQSCRTFPVQAQ